MSSNQFVSLQARAEAKRKELGLGELPKGIRDAIVACQTRYTAINLPNLSEGAKQIATGKFILALESLEKKVKEFESKTAKSVRSSGGSLLDETTMLKKALRHVELNNMVESYRKEHERRMKELQEMKDNLVNHVPAEQQNDFRAMITALAKRG